MVRILCVALLFGAVSGASFLAAEPESEAHHYFNRRDSTDRELAEINDEIHAAEQDFVKDVSKPTSFLQVADSEEHHYFNKKDPTDMQLEEIEDEMNTAADNFAGSMSNASSEIPEVGELPLSKYTHRDSAQDLADAEESKIDAEINDDMLAQDLADPYSLSFLQVGAKPESEEHHYFNSRDPTDRALKKIDDEIHAAEEDFVKDMTKGSKLMPDAKVQLSEHVAATQILRQNSTDDSVSPYDVTFPYAGGTVAPPKRKSYEVRYPYINNTTAPVADPTNATVGEVRYPYINDHTEKAPQNSTPGEVTYPYINDIKKPEQPTFAPYVAPVTQSPAQKAAVKQEQAQAKQVAKIVEKAEKQAAKAEKHEAAVDKLVKSAEKQVAKADKAIAKVDEQMDKIEKKDEQNTQEAVKDAKGTFSKAMPWNWGK